MKSSDFMLEVKPLNKEFWVWINITELVESSKKIQLLIVGS